MVGLRHLATRSAPIAVKSEENMSMKAFGCISLMSAPAAKALSPPVSTMHPILSSASRSSIAAAISPNTPNESALSILGRLSVMTPTAPLPSTMMCSNVLMIHPEKLDSRQCARCGGGLQVGGHATKGNVALSRNTAVSATGCAHGDGNSDASAAQIMNMRAAEPSVSRVPAALKIFPTIDALSQPAPSSFVALTWVALGSVAAEATASAGRWSALSERSTASGCAAALVSATPAWSAALGAPCWPSLAVTPAVAGHGDASVANEGAPMHAKN